MTLAAIRDIVPARELAQLCRARDVLERHLSSTLLAVHLYGSAVDGGLKPHSDLDLLVTVSMPMEEPVRRALLSDLLRVSAPLGARETAAMRPLEVTVVVHGDVVPWRYPPRRELQYGEWLREEIVAGVFGPAVVDADLTILLAKVRKSGIALLGPAAEELLDPVPERDFAKALTDVLGMWKTPSDWAGDERNVVLTLARIWYSAATGAIAPKDAAADWALKRLPDNLRAVLFEARQAYVGKTEDRLASRPQEVESFVHFAKDEAAKLLKSGFQS